MFNSLKIALRFLRKSYLQTFIIILAISICVSVQIFIGLVSKGLESTLINKFVGGVAHITIRSEKGSIEEIDDVKNKIKGIDGVTGVASNIDTQGSIKVEAGNEPVLVRGFDFEELSKVYGMKSNIYDGKMVSGSNEVIIGKELGEKLEIDINDTIDIFTPPNKSTALKVVGFYDLGNANLNKAWVITGIKEAQLLGGLSEEVKSIEISVKNPYDADLISRDLQNKISDEDLIVQNWKDENKLLVSGIVGQKICSAIIQGFVLLGTVLSIICILSISVVQKFREIGILKAMGMGNIQTSMIFVFESIILVALGTAIGIGLVFLYIEGFNRYIITPDGLPVVNIIIDKDFILKSAMVSIASSVFAALFPAIKSFKLTPVEVIKNE